QVPRDISAHVYRSYPLVPAYPYTSPPSNSSLLLLHRPPPRSTLFPYTTLFRSGRRALGASTRCDPVAKTSGSPPTMPAGCLRNRSEEHTSELQSHLNLVCRLLLEKKNNKKSPRLSLQTESDLHTILVTVYPMSP